MAAGLMWYAETRAFTDDEGFHLLAAQLIKGGMRPYIDFCFPQTPLNAYWNAFLLRVLGETWRGPHALAALETSAATVLAAQFVLTRLPERAWQVAGAIGATVMIGCNINLVEFGPLGQAYGMALFMTVCAFRVALPAVERRGWWLAFACGAFAGAAAASTLLAAAATPVLVCWIWWFNRAGSRWIKAAAFAVGGSNSLFARSLVGATVTLAGLVQYRQIPTPLSHGVLARPDAARPGNSHWLARRPAIAPVGTAGAFSESFTSPSDPLAAGSAARNSISARGWHWECQRN